MECKIEIPSIDGLLENELTVGREFILHCQGEWPKGFNPDKAQLLVPENAKYALRLKGFEFRDLSTADLKVVSYQVGPVRLDQLQVQSADQIVSLSPLQFELKSVIEQPKDPEQKVEPYGPFGPALIAWPLVYTLILAVVFVALAGWLGTKIYRRQQRKRLLEEMSEHDSSLDPLQQFYQATRALQRKNPVFFAPQASPQDIREAVNGVDHALRLYLCRHYQIPAFKWNHGTILRDFKARFRIQYKDSGHQLQSLLRELEQARLANQLEVADAHMLLKKSRRWVESQEEAGMRGER